MADLPTVGGSGWTWGTELNTWLLVAHKTDGTLKDLITNLITTSYILVLEDSGLVIEINAAEANVLTIPPNSDVAFPIGTVIEILQYGAGQVTITPGVGVTIRSPDGSTKLRTQYSSAVLRKRATNEWMLVGDLIS